MTAAAVEALRDPTVAPRLELMTISGCATAEGADWLDCVVFERNARRSSHLAPVPLEIRIYVQPFTTIAYARSLSVLINCFADARIELRRPGLFPSHYL